MPSRMKYCTVATLLALQLFFIVVDADLQGHCMVNSSRVSNLTAMCSNFLKSLNNVDTSISNQTLILSSREYILERVLLFKTVRNIRIVGHANTTIKCVGEDAGFMFRDSQFITLESIVISGCGGLFNSTSTNLSDTINGKTLVSLSAVYFERCTNVALNNLLVEYSPGAGVTMYNTNGFVHFMKSHFKFNGQSEKEGLPRSGGVYIEFSLCNPGVLFNDCNSTTKNRRNAIYKFQGSNFESNNAQTINSEKSSFVKLSGAHRKNNQQTLGSGGGLALVFTGPAKNISLNIINCRFVKNTAISGGGLYLNFEGTTSDVYILIEGSNLTENEANYSGGALVYQIISNTVFNISVTFRNCHILENIAENGGGFFLSYNSFEGTTNMKNTLLFDSLHFVENSAKYGSAVDALLNALEGYNGPHPVFKNCFFISNSVSRTLQVDADSALSQSFYGAGTFTISRLAIDFNESVVFEKNIGAPLWAVSSRISFNSPMKARFFENIGMEGGAIGLVSFSVVFFRDNVEFKFIRNSAYNYGGAIYSFQYGKQHLLGASFQCPLQYIGNRNINNRNVSFYFEDNTLLDVATNKSEHGPSIYMTSIQPCVFLCEINPEAKLTIHNMFSCIGNVVFNSSSNVSIKFNEEVSTSGQMFSLTDNYTLSALYLVPGKVSDLPVTVINDLGDPLPYRSYRPRIFHPDSKIVIDPAYQLITQQTLKVYGPVGANSIIVFESTGPYRFLLNMKIKLVPCPPGFYSDYLQVSERGAVKSQLSCTCNWNNTSHAVYQGVSCNSAAFEAQVRHIYWIGYISNYTIPEHLFTGLCPQHFCYSGLKISPLHVLPFNASYEVLNNLVCGPNRRGVLCGECAEGYTVLYHSVYFKCSVNHLCHIGFLFFLISEIIPLTIMFVVIVLSNVNFSSGALNGFILFAQVLDSLSIGAYGMLEFQLIKSHPFYHMTVLYQFIYRVLNLDFFTEDKFSFCLWEGATTLEMLAFKFVAIFYAFLLVLVTVLIINKCKLKTKLCHSLRIATIRSYIIHGLSAFLITCYIKCAQIAFHILIPGRLMGMPSSSFEHNPRLKVVLFSGNIEYLSSAHWPYAFPAILVIFIVCLPPPFLLLWYPLGRQALAIVIKKCSVYNYRLRNGGWSCCHVSAVDKMKPLLDSFQSCYKDNCRYFAGLQFVYRLIILCTFNLTETPLIFYTVVGVELSLMLVVHVIFWPYREQWHNIVDTLIYSNILLVNGFTIFIYSSSVNFSSTFVYEAAVIQTLLIYLPLIYIIGYTTVMVWRVLKPKVIKKKKRTMTALDDGFPARLIQNSYETSYTLDNM